MMTPSKLAKFRKKMRVAVANYLSSEGCQCCEGMAHKNHKEALAKLLNVRKYKDGSGYDWSPYESDD